MTDAAPTLGLLFVLGLRHAMDPDHVAVIDNIVFRSVDAQPRLARWTGTLFAIGHSLSVAAVALGVALLAGRVALPDWIGAAIDALVVALLFVVGTLNLRALLHGDTYVPVGWRARMVPSRLRDSTHPLAVLAIGIVFGLVFDTATQAAAWGAAATVQGGIATAGAIAAAFALGMTLADSFDSQIVARLLTASGRAGAVVRYRRAVGWLIVALSYGMGLVALADVLGVSLLADDRVATASGIACAATVVALLLRAWWAGRPPSPVR